MKKTTLLAVLLAYASIPAIAQMPKVVPAQKWDGKLAQLLDGKTLQQRVGAKTTMLTADSLMHLNINAKDAYAVAADLEKAGYEANVITDAVLTARIPATYVKQLAEREDVVFVKTSKTGRPYMDKARADVGADRIHAGEGLETPFTGKGVVIGVIDQGFEYRHAAFLDADGLPSRVRAVWELNKAGAKPTTTIPQTGDNWNGPGHGTHVTNIAAGGKVGNKYHGMAPEAEIIMMPSSFADAEVLNGVKYVKEFAEKEGKPWIVNMSFGSEVGSHDGTDLVSQTLDKLTGEGGHVTVAMGNAGGEKLHAHYVFPEDQTASLFVAPAAGDDGQAFYFNVYGQNGDGIERLKFKPFLYNLSRQERIYLTAYSISSSGTSLEQGIDPYNGKQFIEMSGSYASLKSACGVSANANVYMGVEIEGTKGEEVHAWIQSPRGSFKKLSNTVSVEGDTDFQTNTRAASNTVIGVGAYTTSRTYYSYNQGKELSVDASFTGHVGGTSNFSSRGPSLGSEPKPTVAGPGCVISSAVSKFDKGVDLDGSSIVDIVKAGALKKYYYGQMSGTSMATPAVAGIMALWLEANPKLTYADMKEIFVKTSRRDEQTGTEEWNKDRGYGKVDAYAGLKLALEKAAETGINETLNTSQPITLSKGADAWKVLFNNDESFARLALYTPAGALVKSNTLASPRRGEEHEVSFAGLTPGVYLLQIATTASTTTKKVIVK